MQIISKNIRWRALMKTYQTAKFDRSPNKLSRDIVLTGLCPEKKKNKKSKNSRSASNEIDLPHYRHYLLLHYRLLHYRHISELHYRDLFCYIFRRFCHYQLVATLLVNLELHYRLMLRYWTLLHYRV